MSEIALIPRPVDDPDVVAISILYRRAYASLVDSVHDLIEAGHRLNQKKIELGHGRWLPWLEANIDVLGFETPRTAQRLIDASVKYDTGVAFTDQKAIEISRTIWGHNVRGAGGTGQTEWYTPAQYVELARSVLGEIDLDPASSPEAQKVVRAKKFFDKNIDGLKQNWDGRVFLNPPYEQPDLTFRLEAVRRAAGRARHRSNYVDAQLHLLSMVSGSR